MTRAPTIGRWFVAMPKAASSTWRTSLMTTPGAVLGDTRHLPAVSVGERDRQGWRVFGCLRDPADWYVSLWRHATADEKHRAHLAAWTGGDTSLSAAVRAWTSGDVPDAAEGRPFVVCPSVSARPMVWRAGEGLWSHAVRYWFQDDADRWSVDDLVHIRDIDATLRAWGIAPRPRRNVRPGEAPTLSADLLDVVRRADRETHREALAFAQWRAAA